MQTHHDIFLAVVGTGAEKLNVALRESGIAETLRHRFGSRGNASDGVSRVDLDQLLENVESQAAGSGVSVRYFLRPQ